MRKCLSFWWWEYPSSKRNQWPTSHRLSCLKVKSSPPLCTTHTQTNTRLCHVIVQDNPGWPMLTYASCSPSRFAPSWVASGSTPSVRDIPGRASKPGVTKYSVSSVVSHSISQGSGMRRFMPRGLETGDVPPVIWWILANNNLSSSSSCWSLVSWLRSGVFISTGRLTCELLVGWVSLLVSLSCLISWLLCESGTFPASSFLHGEAGLARRVWAISFSWLHPDEGFSWAGLVSVCPGGFVWRAAAPWSEVCPLVGSEDGFWVTARAGWPGLKTEKEISEPNQEEVFFENTDQQQIRLHFPRHAPFPPANQENQIWDGRSDTVSSFFCYPNVIHAVQTRISSRLPHGLVRAPSKVKPLNSSSSPWWRGAVQVIYPSSSMISGRAWAKICEPQKRVSQSCFSIILGSSYHSGAKV